MKLNIHVDAGSRAIPGTLGAAAAGIVIGIEDPPELLHEAGYFFGPVSEGVAEYKALIQAIGIVVKVKGVEEVCIYSRSEPLVKQITGAYRVKAADVLPLFEETQMMLLRIDLWQIKQVDPVETQRASDLVNAALDAGQDVVLKEIGKPAVAMPISPSRTSATATEAPPEVVKKWRVMLSGKPCALVEDAPTKSYEFGPCTPAGLCVHAADAVFDTNPLGQLDETTTRLSTACAKCGATVKMELEK